MLTYGVFICDRNEEVPLKSQCVRSFLKGQVVGFRSTLTYVNHTENPLEVFFRTPVDDSFAVVGLEACIDGKKIRAEIQEKEKAREKYKEAVSSGRTAAFGEEKQGDIFSLVLGNLPPKEMAVLELTMVGELNVEAGGAVRFVLPKVLKPRYTPTGSNNPLAPEVSSDSGATAKQGTGPDSYQFSLEIDDAPNIDKVTSPSHKILLTMTVKRSK
ncbi:von Willebrand factor A domain-containing protein 5A-like [Xenia sp. Carnegie-2017]|uniref:von Willebrand factor A domain-containing protein 5A-like n=1 Tax=Xenia sp. Carnegie-2017 TaxID=2897299 RepID=UPI001F04178A|nr:von Willebrand factor A domain-containing protein 5A-like [Xenia sp. Carnegie-2017]